MIHGSVKGWLAVLEELMRQPAERVVPGHGPVQAPWPSAAEDSVRYLTTLRDETRAWLVEGGDLKTAQENIGYSEEQHWRLFSEYHKRNIIAVFTELEWED